MIKSKEKKKQKCYIKLSYMNYLILHQILLREFWLKLVIKKHENS